MKIQTHKMRSTITKADDSAEEVMKGYTGKYTARRTLFIFPILAILLTVSPMPADAGVIDRVNNKVTTILNKVKSIASNTNGLQEFITTLRDIRDSMGGGMISDMKETIGETQDLIQFIKDRRESAGQTSQYPSLHVLVQSLDGIAAVLTDRDGQGGALEGLSAMLAVLPDKVLAPVAKAAYRAGIDAEFVAKIDRMGTDLVELREILDQADARRAAASQVAGIGERFFIDGDGLLIAEFGCHIHEARELVRLSRRVRATKKTAESLKLLGALIETAKSGVETEQQIGIWGWVAFTVKVDVPEALGKLMGIAGDGALVLVESGENIIEKCIAKEDNNNEA